jgi:NAD-dependent DNA ligase
MAKALPCSEQTHEKVRKYCSKKGLKMSAFVDEAIKKYFEYLETGGVE